MILNNAADIKIGSTDVDRVYLGAVKVWERSGDSNPNHVVLLTNSWEQGGIDPSGNEYASTSRVRAIGYYLIGEYNTIRFVAHDPLYPNYLQWGVQGYNYRYDNDQQQYIYYSTTSYEGDWVNNGDSYDISNIIADDITHIRIYLRYSDEGTITVNDFDYAEFFLS